MKEKIKIIILVIIFIIGLIFINTLLKNNDINYKDLEEGINMEYAIQVNENNFETEVLKSEKKVLIDFYADWCGPCKMLSPIVEDIAKSKSDIKVVKVNVDECQDISVKYQIMSIPTLVVIENGQEITRSVGVISKEEILNLLGN